VTLALYMDHHVPEAITSGLRRRGVNVLTAWDDGRARTSDEELLTRATELGRVLFSQDDDLLAVAAAWQTGGRPFGGVIYGHQLRVTIGQAVVDLDLMAHVLEPKDMLDHVEFLPL